MIPLSEQHQEISLLMLFVGSFIVNIDYDHDLVVEV